jgi:fructose-1,6-bisphosphatase/inositol monophosphatase family enzyme
MLTLRDITLATNVLTLQVGQFIREQQDQLKASDVQTKSLNSLVSYVDVEAEKMLVGGLEETRSGCRISYGRRNHRSGTG